MRDKENRPSVDGRTELLYLLFNLGVAPKVEIFKIVHDLGSKPAREIADILKTEMCITTLEALLSTIRNEESEEETNIQQPDNVIPFRKKE